MCFNFHKPPFATGVLVPPRGVLKHSWIVFPGSWKEPWANSSLRSNKVGTSESWREGEKEVSASTNRGGTIFSSTWTGHIKRKALHFLPSSVLWITRFSARMWWEVHLQHPWWSQQFNIRIVNWNGLQLPVQGRIVPATDTTSDSQQTNQGNAWLWQKSRKKKKSSQHVLRCAVKLVCEQGYVKSSHCFQPTPPAPAVPISQALLLHRDQWGCWGQNRTTLELLSWIKLEQHLSTAVF